MDQGKSSTHIAIDLDRLHKVSAGESIGRGAGKTFANCCEVINLLYLEKSPIVCLIKYFKDFYSIIVKIAELLTKENIVFKIEDRTIKGVTNCGINFIIHLVAKEAYEDFARGKEFYLVNFIDY